MPYKFVKMSKENKKGKSIADSLKNIGRASLISLPLFFSGLNANAQTDQEDPNYIYS